MGVGAGTFALAGTAASVIGTGVSVYGAIQQGQAQKSAADYQAQVARNNATVAQQNADAVQQQAAAKAQRDQTMGDLRLGAQRAALGASGTALGTGSGNAVQSATVVNTGLTTAQDIQQGALAGYGYTTQATNYDAQAGLDTAQAANAQTAGFTNAGSTLLSGASQVSNKWASYLTPQPNPMAGLPYAQATGGLG